MSNEVVYVSWGGTGRAVTLREALRKANDQDKGLLYLAILDDSTFSDIDDAMMALAKDELSWLLDSQLELTKSQLGASDIPVRVLIRDGSVIDEVDEVVSTLGETEVLVGAPVPIAGHDTIGELIDVLSARLSVPVSLI